MNRNRINIIMLSYAKNDELYSMTKNALRSLKTSEGYDYCHVYLVETNSSENITYDEFNFVTVIKPNEYFNYNKFVNIAYSKIEKQEEYVMIVNNDVIFHPYWFSNADLLMDLYQLDSASPICPILENTYGGVLDYDIFRGYGVGVKFYGWALIFKTTKYEEVQPLDETFSFWMQDIDLEEECYKRNFNHALLMKSKVTHLISKSNDILDEKQKEEYFVTVKEKFMKKYGLDYKYRFFEPRV